MASRAAGPGTPVNDEQRVRWQPAVNTSQYDAPPFAAMMRGVGTSMGSVDDSTWSGEVIDGAWCWHVGRPDRYCEIRQRATDIVFAGPEGILAGRPGRVTEDWPARALHLKSDTLHITPTLYTPGGGAFYAGPKAGSWLLWDSGNAFRWLAYNDAFQDSNFESGFVAPAPKPFVGASFILTDGSANRQLSIAALAKIGSSPAIWWIESGSNTSIASGPTSYDFTQANPTALGGIIIPNPGVYEWKFHCSATSSVAPQGSTILIKSYLDDLVLTSYCQRLLQLEIDNYGTELTRSMENMAMSGITTTVSSNQLLNFRNLSSYAIDVYAAFCQVRRIEI